jgi:hypothetical protein
VTARPIVLDGNILVRAVLGSRVPDLLAAHAARATFLAPDVAFDDVREHLPSLLRCGSRDMDHRERRAVLQRRR